MEKKDVIKLVEKVGKMSNCLVFDDSWNNRDGSKTRRLKFWGMKLSEDKLDSLKKELVGKEVGDYEITDVRPNTGSSGIYDSKGTVCVIMKRYLN